MTNTTEEVCSSEEISETKTRFTGTLSQISSICNETTVLLNRDKQGTDTDAGKTLIRKNLASIVKYAIDLHADFCSNPRLQ